MARGEGNTLLVWRLLERPMWLTIVAVVITLNLELERIQGQRSPRRQVAQSWREERWGKRAGDVGRGSSLGSGGYGDNTHIKRVLVTRAWTK